MSTEHTTARAPSRNGALARLGFAEIDRAERTFRDPVLAGLVDDTSAVPAGGLTEGIGRTSDPDLALPALVRLLEALADRPGGRAGTQHELRQVLADDSPRRARLLAVLGGSTALADHLVGHPDTWRDAADATHRDAEQLRDTALGRPGAGYLLREAARWPSEVLLMVLRVGLATTLAGLVAHVLHQGHVYWAVCFAALVLHQGGTREVQTVRGVHRTLGTLVGLLIFAGLLALDPQGWWLVLVVAGMQLVVELLITRNYALAVVVITPLALTIGLASAPGEPVSSVVADRLVDTLVGVACALLVLWATGRRAPEVVLRAHARRVVVATERVMVDLAAGALETRDALDHRRNLYYELLESDVVARRALADSRDTVGPYHRMERSLAALGYLVLGACWHPDIRRAHEAFDRARGPLERIMADPVTTPRPAEAIERDVREVEALVLSLR